MKISGRIERYVRRLEETQKEIQSLWVGFGRVACKTVLMRGQNLVSKIVHNTRPDFDTTVIFGNDSGSHSALFL